MNFIVKKDDSVGDLINKRIAWFKDLACRYPDEKTLTRCRLRIATLEMVLHDIENLRNIKNTKLSKE